MTARSQRSLRSSSFMIKAALTGRAARNWSRRLCCRNRKGRDLLAFLETLTSTPTTSRCLFCRDDRGRGASSRRTRRYRSSWAVCAVVATRCSFCSSARPSRSFSDFVEPSKTTIARDHVVLVRMMPAWDRMVLAHMIPARDRMILGRTVPDRGHMVLAGMHLAKLARSKSARQGYTGRT